MADPSSTEDELQARIVELEVKVAYQDKALRDLDEIVVAYAARVDELARQLTELRQRTDDSASAGEITDEPPPHY